MKIKWGALVVDGRNKIGGQVASKNRAGAYLRNKVTPVNPSSANQVTVRARLGSLSQAWRGLSAVQRSAWNAAVGDYSKTDIFGDIRNPSGFNLFVRLNANLVNAGESQINTPPSPVAVPVLSSFTLAAAEGTPALEATVAPADIAANTKILAFATAPQSPGKSYVKAEYRQISVVDTYALGSIDLLSAYQAKFGSVSPAGNKIFVKLVHVSTVTGQTSQAQEASAIIAA